MTTPLTLFGPYGTRLEQKAEAQGFQLGGPTDVISNSSVRSAIGSIAREYLNSGACGMTIPCFGSRQLINQNGGYQVYQEALTESFGIILDHLSKLRQSVRQKLTLFFCVGPANDCYAPEKSPGVLESAEFHEIQISTIQRITQVTGISPIILFETIPSGREAEGIALALKKRNQISRPLNAIISYPFTYQGSPLGDKSFVDIFRRVKKVGSHSLIGQSLNCGPIEGAAKALSILSRQGERVLGIYPNASSRPHHLLNEVDTHHGLPNREATAAFLKFLAAQHALHFIGGCCGYNHEDIAALSEPGLMSPVLPPTDWSPALTLCA